MATPRKILHIIKSLGRGGAEMLLPESLQLHDKKNFEFHYIYFLPWKDQMVESLREAGGIVSCIPSNNNISLLLRAGDVIRYVRQNNIELIHAHLPWAGVLARYVGKRTRIRVIYTEHNKQERYHWATRRINLLTLNWAAKVIAVSRDVETSIKKFKPSLQTSLTTVLNGVNVVKFRPGLFNGSEVRQQLNIPVQSSVIGCVSVFRFQKRLDLWLESAAQIINEFKNTHFILVGEGPLKDNLVKKRDALGLSDRVHMVGLQTEVRPYLAAMDIYMMSSIFEGLPIALLEAMASGCAVITTDAGGIKEVIRDGVDGLVCSVDEPGKLPQLARRLLSDSDELVRLGVNARTRVENDFSMQRMVTSLEEIYQAETDRRT